VILIAVLLEGQAESLALFFDPEKAISLILLKPLCKMQFTLL
jgi:hypothetical protein